MSDEYEYPDISDPTEIFDLLSWEDAAGRWLSSDSAAGWICGDQNLRRMVAKIFELELQDVSDKLGALTLAYQALCEEGTLDEPEEDE
jgi:hypothetical protein